MKQIRLTSRNRGQNRQNIAVAQAGCQTVLKADIVVVDINIDETVSAAAGNEFFLDPRVLLFHMIDNLGDLAAFDIDVLLLIREWS
mgnify:CR=1 FL=1